MTVVVVELDLADRTRHVNLNDDLTHLWGLAGGRQVCVGEATVGSCPCVVTTGERCHVSLKDIVPWCVAVDEVSNDLGQTTGHLALSLGCLGCLGNLHTSLSVDTISLLLSHGRAAINQVITSTTGATAARIVGQLVVNLVNSLVLRTGHVDTTLDHGADACVLEHVVNPCVASDVPLLAVASTDTGSMLTDDMADLMAQQEYKLVNRQLLNELLVVVNLAALVNSRSRNGVVRDKLALHQDGSEEGMLRDYSNFGAVEFGNCHDDSLESNDVDWLSASEKVCNCFRFVFHLLCSVLGQDFYNLTG